MAQEKPSTVSAQATADFMYLWIWGKDTKPLFNFRLQLVVKHTQLN